MKKINLLPAVLALTAASVACSPAAENKSGNTAAPVNNTTAAQPAANQAQPAANASGAMPPEMQAKAGRNGQQLHLAENGFTTGSVGLHHANQISFGQSQAEVTNALTEILGPPTESGRNGDCPDGAVDYANFSELGVHFRDGKFVGWVLDGPMRPELETHQGLMIGQSRSEISARDGDAPTFEQSSLGSEFQSEGVGGLLEGEGANARVRTLFSGVTCFAR